MQFIKKTSLRTNILGLIIKSVTKSKKEVPTQNKYLTSMNKTYTIAKDKIIINSQILIVLNSSKIKQIRKAFDSSVPSVIMNEKTDNCYTRNYIVHFLFTCHLSSFFKCTYCTRKRYHLLLRVSIWKSTNYCFFEFILIER